jgi:cation diffusion facilitator family transporter
MIELLRKQSRSTENSIRLSFIVSLSDIFINVVAAIITGSAVLLSQALQGISDAISSLFVYFGYHHSRKRANNQHPLGYGREVFFWVLIASVITGGTTGFLSIERGLAQVRTPVELETTFVAFIVLVIGLITNSYSVRSSLGSLAQNRRNPLSTLKQFIGSSFVETKMSILIDSLGTFSAFVGLVSLGLYVTLDNVHFDGYGAITIGVITLLGSFGLIFDIYGLIIGKSASLETILSIKSKTLAVDGVQKIKHVKAVLIGSGLLLVIVDVIFENGLSSLQIEHRSEKIRKKLRSEIPGVKHVVVESYRAQPPATQLLHVEGKRLRNL